MLEFALLGAVIAFHYFATTYPVVVAHLIAAAGGFLVAKGGGFVQSKAIERIQRERVGECHECKQPLPWSRLRDR